MITRRTVLTGVIAMASEAGNAIAVDALQYQGTRYTWGGSASIPGNWDCSSFVSYVLGHDLGIPLPGGGSYGDPGYPPHTHGPDVAGYLAWDGAQTLGRKETPQPGDLVIWAPNGHIGIATGPDTMISALDTAQGTVASPVNGYGPAGTSVVYRRLTGVGTVPTGAGGLPGAAASGIVSWVENHLLGPAIRPFMVSLILGDGLGVGLVVIGAGAVILVTEAAAGIVLLFIAARNAAG